METFRRLGGIEDARPPPLSALAAPLAGELAHASVSTHRAASVPAAAHPANSSIAVGVGALPSPPPSNAGAALSRTFAEDNTTTRLVRRPASFASWRHHPPRSVAAAPPYSSGMMFVDADLRPPYGIPRRRCATSAHCVFGRVASTST